MRTKVNYRQIYIDNYGAIPYGYHIHHIDCDSHNNDPSNLEALHPIEHAQRHMDMGQKAVAALILSTHEEYIGHLKVHNEAFGTSRGVWGNRKWNVETPVMHLPRSSRFSLLKYNNDFDDPDYSHIMDAIQTLSPRQQTIVEMLFGFNREQYTIDEIAFELDLNEKTIRRDKNIALSIIELQINFKFV